MACCTFGISVTQGAHHVAQNVSTVTWPFRSDEFTTRPSSVEIEKEGTDLFTGRVNIRSATEGINMKAAKTTAPTKSRTSAKAHRREPLAQSCRAVAPHMAGGSDAKTTRAIASGAVNAARVADAVMAANEPPALTSKPFNQGLTGGLWPRRNPANRYRSAVTIKNARR